MENLHCNVWHWSFKARFFFLVICPVKPCPLTGDRSSSSISHLCMLLHALHIFSETYHRKLIPKKMTWERESIWTRQAFYICIVCLSVLLWERRQPQHSNISDSCASDRSLELWSKVVAIWLKDPKQSRPVSTLRNNNNISLSVEYFDGLARYAQYRLYRSLVVRAFYISSKQWWVIIWENVLHATMM